MKKILIVDDQKEVRELVDVTLRRDDYIVFQASNGQEAIDVARKEKPDLIIMDIMMPGKIDGIEATRILKNNPETKNMVILMLTAKSQQIDLTRGIEAGADDYFVKPFSPLNLIRKVESVLER